MKLTVLVHEAEEGGYWGEVPMLPGCVSEGETLHELKSNIAEAIEGWLAVQAEKAHALAKGSSKKLGKVRELAVAV